MSYATMPEVIGFVAQRLSKITKNFTGASSSSAGLPGLVPAPTQGTSIRVLLSDGNWSIVNTTNINPKAFTSWAAGVHYDVAGLFLFSQDRLFRVTQPHTSTSIDADIQSGYLTEITGSELSGSVWSPGTIYNKNRIATFNGQLVQSLVSHISTTFAADCIAGKWKFVANTQIATTATGTNFYSFTGHVVLKDSQLWTCITPHVAATWVGANWLSLANAFTGATATVDGGVGMVPAPQAGQDKHVLVGSGNWTDISTLLGSIGYSGGGGGVSVNATTITGPATVTLDGTHKSKITPVDTSTGVVTINMPASPTAGDTYSLIDATGNWGVSPVSIGSDKFKGTVQTGALDVTNSYVTFMWINANIGWTIVVS